VPFVGCGAKHRTTANISGNFPRSAFLDQCNRLILLYSKKKYSTKMDSRFVGARRKEKSAPGELALASPLPEGAI
jgi:hypothetical protein